MNNKSEMEKRKAASPSVVFAFSILIACRTRDMQIRTKIPSHFLVEPIYESDRETTSRIPQGGGKGMVLAAPFKSKTKANHSKVGRIELLPS